MNKQSLFFQSSVAQKNQRQHTIDITIACSKARRFSVLRSFQREPRGRVLSERVNPISLPHLSCVISLQTKRFRPIKCEYWLCPACVLCGSTPQERVVLNPNWQMLSLRRNGHGLREWTESTGVQRPSSGLEMACSVHRYILRLVEFLVNLCFEPSQPLGIISGLREIFIKRYISWKGHRQNIILNCRINLVLGRVVCLVFACWLANRDLSLKSRRHV